MVFLLSVAGRIRIPSMGDPPPVSRALCLQQAGGGVRRGEKGWQPGTYFSQGLISLFLVLKDPRGNIAYRPPLVLFGFWSPELFLGPTTVRRLLLWLAKAHHWSFPGADPGLCTSRGRSRGVYTLRRWKGLGKKETHGREWDSKDIIPSSHFCSCFWGKERDSFLPHILKTPHLPGTL